VIFLSIAKPPVGRRRCIFEEFIMFSRKVLTCLIGAGLTVAQAQASVITGTISDWQDSTYYGLSLITGQNVDANDPEYAADFDLTWSIAADHQGWFYGTPANGVAYAQGIGSIEQLTNAENLRFTSGMGLVGALCDAACAPNGAGDFLVWKRPELGYLAFQIGDIDLSGYDGDGFPLGTLSGQWWYQTDGSGDFGEAVAAVPEPASIWLLSSGLVALAGVVRRRRIPA
jgi:hypothetical protein